MRFSRVAPFIAAFILIAFTAFVAGLQHATLDKQTLRRFAELILGTALFFIVVDHVRTRKQLEGLATVVVAAVPVPTNFSTAVMLWDMPC